MMESYACNLRSTTPLMLAIGIDGSLGAWVFPADDKFRASLFVFWWSNSDKWHDSGKTSGIVKMSELQVDLCASSNITP